LRNDGLWSARLCFAIIGIFGRLRSGRNGVLLIVRCFSTALGHLVREAAQFSRAPLRVAASIFCSFGEHFSHILARPRREEHSDRRSHSKSRNERNDFHGPPPTKTLLTHRADCNAENPVGVEAAIGAVGSQVRLL